MRCAAGQGQRKTVILIQDFVGGGGSMFHKHSYFNGNLMWPLSRCHVIDVHNATTQQRDKKQGDNVTKHKSTSQQRDKTQVDNATKHKSTSPQRDKTLVDNAIKLVFCRVVDLCFGALLFVDLFCCVVDLCFVALSTCVLSHCGVVDLRFVELSRCAQVNNAIIAASGFHIFPF